MIDFKSFSTSTVLAGVMMTSALTSAGALYAQTCSTNPQCASLGCTTANDCGSCCFCNNPTGGKAAGACYANS